MSFSSNIKQVSMAVGAALVLAGCSGAPSETAPAPQETTPPPPPVEATIAPTKGKAFSSDLSHNNPVVTVTHGKLLSAEIEGLQKGDEVVPGKPQEASQSFGGRLTPGETYSVTVEMQDALGATSTQELPLKVPALPEKTYRQTLYPVDDDVVGVGMPITASFSEPVPEQARREIEKLATVKTAPAQEGSWGWTDGNRTLSYRPKSFWKPGTKVQVNVPLRGEWLGNRYGKQDVSTSFTIGRDQRMVIDDATKSLTVERAGKKVSSHPVSLGKPGHTSSSGVFAVYGKGNPERMRGADYDMMVNWAMRYTAGGEYVHSAPWSVGDQGRRNVSHGCINMSPGAAKKLYQSTLMGDPVIVKGTSRPGDPTNGMTALWNYSWQQWQQKSAL